MRPSVTLWLAVFFSLVATSENPPESGTLLHGTPRREHRCARAEHGDRAHDQDVRRAKHRKNSLIEDTAERDAIGRAKAHEGEPCLADNNRRCRGSELNGDDPEKIGDHVSDKHSETPAPQRHRRFDERCVTKNARLGEREPGEGRPGRQRKDDPNVQARRGTDRAEDPRGPE